MDAEEKLRWDFMQSKMKRYAEMVIKDFKEMGRADGMQSPVDSGLNSLWDEWLVQIHGEHSFYYEQYEGMIRTNAECLIKELPEDEIGLIWLESETKSEYLDGLDGAAGDQRPSLSAMREGATAALFEVINDLATNQKLPDNVEKYLLEDGEV